MHIVQTRKTVIKVVLKIPNGVTCFCIKEMPA